MNPQATTFQLTLLETKIKTTLAIHQQLKLVTYLTKQSKLDPEITQVIKLDFSSRRGCNRAEYQSLIGVTPTI